LSAKYITGTAADTSSEAGLNGKFPPGLEKRLRPLATPALAAYWLLIFLATHVPNPEDLPAPDVSDKLLHFSAYFVLYALLSVWHRLLTSGWPGGNCQLKFLLLTTSYAALDELLQMLPGINRNADWLDGIAVCGGLLTAAAIVWLIRFRVEGIRRSSQAEQIGDANRQKSEPE